MFFKRLYGAGIEKNRRDPRDKIWAEFECSLCGETSDIDVTRVMDTFDFNRERKCPHCKMTNFDDRELNLKAQLDKLTLDKTRLEIEIDKIERELSELKSVDKE